MNAVGCACGGTGTVLVEGPCDAAPLEAPCPCLGREATVGAMRLRARPSLVGRLLTGWLARTFGAESIYPEAAAASITAAIRESA